VTGAFFFGMVLGEYLAQAMGRVEEQIASSTSLVLHDRELSQAKVRRA
jgi:hypothetical protein